MNHRDRQALEQLLEQLWRSRQGVQDTTNPRRGYLTGHQLELLAAAMRIVAGSTNGPNLPPPPYIPESFPESFLNPTRPHTLEANHDDTATTTRPDDPAMGLGTADPGLPLGDQEPTKPAPPKGRGSASDPIAARNWPSREPARHSTECTICSTYHAKPGWRHRLIQWLSNR